MSDTYSLNLEAENRWKNGMKYKEDMRIRKIQLSKFQMCEEEKKTFCLFGTDFPSGKHEQKIMGSISRFYDASKIKFRSRKFIPFHC